MQLNPTQSNCLTIKNIHIFAGFTPQNLQYVKSIVPLTVPVFHVFVNQNTVAANNTAIQDLVRYCIETRTKWRKPMALNVYGPLRHTSLKLWLKNHMAGFGRDVVPIFIQNKKFFGVEEHALNERLVVEYLPKHRSPQELNFSYEKISPTGDPPASIHNLGSYPTQFTDTYTPQFKPY